MKQKEFEDTKWADRSRKTDKTMANKMKQKKNIEHNTTLKTKTKIM